MYFNEVLFILGFITNTAFLVVITLFFKFHLELMFGNNTTIENMDKVRNPNNVTNVKF